ncbi:MAG: hypothetical protein AAF927_16505 [Bacteroidota bacterium]
MKKTVFRFILLLLLALGISGAIYSLTVPPEKLAHEAQKTAQHWVSYQLPLGLPSLSFYW